MKRKPKDSIQSIDRATAILKASQAGLAASA